MKKEILIIDSTLRDGSHAMRHKFNPEDISSYARGAELAGTKILIVGHGNGLGASSLQLGPSLLSDKKMLQITKKELKKTKLGAFLIPGFSLTHWLLPHPGPLPMGEGDTSAAPP